GVMLVFTDIQGRVRALDWEDYEDRTRRLLLLHYGEDGVELAPGRPPANVRQAFDAYLDGELDALDTLEVETAGTDFQRSVWSALRQIPPGTTTHYGALARTI